MNFYRILNRERPEAEAVLLYGDLDLSVHQFADLVERAAGNVLETDLRGDNYGLTPAELAEAVSAESGRDLLPVPEPVTFEY